MNQEKYIGMDVHQATIAVAVMDSSGQLIMECILETKAATILEFIDGLRGTLSVTFEEGTSAAWLHDLLKPHVSHLVVCDPRRNALLRDGSKSDRIDARKLAEWAGSRDKIFSPSGRGRTFFLTSLFIELIDVCLNQHRGSRNYLQSGRE
jgi:transposase